MSLPLRSDLPSSPPDSSAIPPPEKPVTVITSLRRQPKVGVDMVDAAQREAEVVIRRAEENSGGDPFSALHILGDQVADAYDQALQTTASAVCRGLNAVEQLVETRPEHLVAIVAGAAFVTGIVLRVWRTHA